MLDSIRDGLRTVGQSWGLAVLVWVVNLAVAAVLAVPLAGILERSLYQTEAAETMMYGFDYPWWSEWSDEQSGWTTSFGPDTFGAGFVPKNLDLLLKGLAAPAYGRFLARFAGDLPS